MMSERYAKKTLKNTSNNRCGDWIQQLREGKRKGRIRIMFQNMGGMVNISDQSSQHKLDTLKRP